MMTILMTLMKENITRAKFINRFINFFCCSFPLKLKKKNHNIKAIVSCIWWTKKKEAIHGEKSRTRGAVLHQSVVWEIVYTVAALNKTFKSVAFNLGWLICCLGMQTKLPFGSTVFSLSLFAFDYNRKWNQSDQRKVRSLRGQGRWTATATRAIQFFI